MEEENLFDSFLKGKQSAKKVKEKSKKKKKKKKEKPPEELKKEEPKKEEPPKKNERDPAPPPKEKKKEDAPAKKPPPPPSTSTNPRPASGAPRDVRKEHFVEWVVNGNPDFGKAATLLFGYHNQKKRIKEAKSEEILLVPIKGIGPDIAITNPEGEQKTPNSPSKHQRQPSAKRRK